MKKYLFLSFALCYLSSFASTIIQGNVTGLSMSASSFNAKVIIKPTSISSTEAVTTKRTFKNELVIYMTSNSFCFDFIKSTISSNGILTLEADLEDGNTVVNNKKVSCTISKI